MLLYTLYLVLLIFLHDSNEIKDLKTKLANVKKEGEEIKKKNTELKEKSQRFENENESNLQIITKKKYV